jgi:hypothetical protein
VKSGKSFNLTASATCSGTPVYEWWLGTINGSTWSWQQLTPYGAVNSFTWSTAGLPAGSYVIDVWIEKQGSSPTSFDTYTYLPFTVAGH